MKKITSLVLIAICFGSCVLKKTHDEITKDLNSKLQAEQNKTSTLSNQLNSDRDKLKQIGATNVASSTSAVDEKRADAFKDDSSWVSFKNPDLYKGYLTAGLGIIWLQKTDGGFVEGGFLDLARYKLAPEIIDQGDVIFKYFVNNKFTTKVSAVAIATASMNTEDYAKLDYEILGTSRLKILQDSLESIAKQYAAGRYSSDVKGVYLATGFHVRKVSLQTYTKMAANAVATVPVANVNGEFYNESQSIINNWFVEAKLLDLKLFIKNKDLEHNKALAKGQTPYKLLKSIFGETLSEEKLIEIANNPELMTTEKIDELKAKLGRQTILKTDLEKLNSVGTILLKSKTNFQKSN